MKTLALSRNKSFEWSFGLHAAILAIAFLPFVHKVVKEQPITYIMEVGFLETIDERSIGSEGLQARSEVYHDEPEPTMDQPVEDPVPVDEVEPVEEMTIAENNSQVISDVTSEDATDIVASESAADGADAETNASGGGMGSPIEGNQDGAAMEGDGGGGDGLDGDGIITRKVIYRENITGVAKVNGRVTLKICIDRQGRVIYAAYDPEKTTITDTQIIKDATYLATRYRFESKYDAPKKEWGSLTFIFSIDEDIASN
jgi:hypothetical protein